MNRHGLAMALLPFTWACGRGVEFGGPCTAPLDEHCSPCDSFADAYEDALVEVGGEEKLLVYRCGDGRQVVDLGDWEFHGTIEIFDADGRMIGAYQWSDVTIRCSPRVEAIGTEYGRVEGCETECFVDAVCEDGACDEILASAPACGETTP